MERIPAYMIMIGSFLMAWSLAAIWKRRYVENLPFSKISSAAMGIVKISGKTWRLKDIYDPLTLSPCCWWHYVFYLNNEHFWEISSQELFFVEDDTGRIMVDPNNLQMHGFAPEQLKLTDYHYDLMVKAFPGLSDQIRCVQGKLFTLKAMVYLIRRNWPVMVVGQLGPAKLDFRQKKVFLDDRKTRFDRYLREVKSDKSKIMEADTNKDGMIDPEEWDAFRLKLEEEFYNSEMIGCNETKNNFEFCENNIIYSPEKRPFIVSIDERDITKSYSGILSVLSAAIGLVLVVAGWAAMGDIEFDLRLACTVMVLGVFIGVSAAAIKINRGITQTAFKEIPIKFDWIVAVGAVLGILMPMFFAGLCGEWFLSYPSSLIQQFLFAFTVLFLAVAPVAVVGFVKKRNNKRKK